MKRNRLSGVTLVELLVVLAILSVLGMYMPALSDVLVKQRLLSSQSDLRLLITRARADALTMQRRITLCPLLPDGRCSTVWAGTLSVFADSNGNRRQDPDEELLSVLQLEPSIKLQWRGMNPANSLHFSAQGVTFVSNGTFSLCSIGHNETLRIVVNRQGRTRTERAKQDCQGNPTI